MNRPKVPISARIGMACRKALLPLFVGALALGVVGSTAQVSWAVEECLIDLNPSKIGPTPLFPGDTVSTQIVLSLELFDTDTWDRVEIPGIFQDVDGSDTLDLPSLTTDITIGAGCVDESENPVTVATIDNGGAGSSIFAATFNNPLVLDSIADSCTISWDVTIPGGTLPTIIGTEVGVLEDGVNPPALQTECVTEEGQGLANDETEPVIYIVNKCSAEIDKQISCDGGNTWVDITDVNDGSTCSGFKAWTSTDGAEPATNIKVRYKAKNTGTVDFLSCDLDESNTQFADPSVASPGTIGDSFVEVANDTKACSDDLTLGEPDTATLNCVCRTEVSEVNTGDVTDTADFDCLVPDIDIDKRCDSQASDSNAWALEWNDDDSTATVANCVVTDEYFDGLCSVADTTPGTGTTVPVTHDGTPNGSDSGSIVGLTADVCNVGTITCEVAGTGKSISDFEEMDCIVAVCGDGNIDRDKGETCDPDDSPPWTDGCRNPGETDECTFCGDDIRQATSGETCDGLDTPDGFTCRDDCTFCGDDIRNGNEFCDGEDVPDGFIGTCRDDCTACGDNILQPGLGEECDDGNNIDGDGCSAICEDERRGCLTRTPGYWPNHPDESLEILIEMGPLPNCGVLPLIGKADAEPEGSSVEEMCSIGREAKAFGIDNTSANLRRHCMAANLNVAASEYFGESCDTRLVDVVKECIGGPKGGYSCGLKDDPSAFCNPLVCAEGSTNEGAICVNDQSDDTETDDCGEGYEDACGPNADGPFACAVPHECAEGSTNEGDPCVNDLNAGTETDDCGEGYEDACEPVLGGTDLMSECCNDGSICALAEDTDEGGPASKSDVNRCLGLITAFNESEDTEPLDETNLCKDLENQEGNCSADSNECKEAATNGKMNTNPWNLGEPEFKGKGKP